MIQHILSGWWFGTWLLFSISHINDNPNPIDELIFFKMVIAPPTSYPLVTYLTVRHGIDGPNRNRWFTVLKNGCDLSMQTVSHNQRLNPIKSH